MRIAIFSDNFFPEISGISDSIIATSKELAAQGHEVAFFVPRYSQKDFAIIGAPHKELDLGSHIKIIRLLALPFPTPTQQARAVIPTLQAFWQIRKFKPDIIHSHLIFGAGLLALFASRLFKIPLVSTNHTSMSALVKSARLKKFLSWYSDWYFNQCHVVTAPSKITLEDMRLRAEVSRFVVSNPLDLKKFQPAPTRQIAQEPTIIFAGCLRPEKKIDSIIKALPLIRQAIPEARLVIAGHGSDYQNLKQLSEDLMIDDSVIFTGTLTHTELARYYHRSQIFAVASTAETQCLAMLQAMACGLPAVGVRARGLPEYITQNNGLLCQPDDHHDLARAIIALFQDHDLRLRYAQGAIKSTRQFSARAIAQQWQGIYQQAVRTATKDLKLSFVIPAYNEAAYIGKCLESVLRAVKQAPYDTEVIVVNNASTDNTAAIARSFTGVRVVDEPIKGIVHARHAGFVTAHGDLIANLDADTIVPTDWLQQVVHEFTHDDKLVALSGPFIYHDVSKHIQRWVRFYYSIGFISYLMNRFILRIGSMLQGGNFIIRKTALERAGGYDRSLIFYGEDADIARRLHYLGNVKFTFALPMYTSGRRIIHEGMLTMGVRYSLNYLWTIFFHRPFSTHYTDVRSPKIKHIAIRRHLTPTQRRLANVIALSFASLIVVSGLGFFTARAWSDPDNATLARLKLKIKNSKVITKINDLLDRSDKERTTP